MIAPDLIRFEGPWTESEIGLIEAAVANAEDGDVPTTSEGERAPWVGTCHKKVSTNMYAISRIGHPEVLSARSAPSLAEQIRELDLSRRKKLEKR